MSSTVIVINLFALSCLIFAFVKDRGKAKKSLAVAVKAFFRILPMVFIIIVLIGLLLAFVPPDEISGFIGEQAGFGGILAVAVLGAVLYIPALISFPLAGSLLQSGASISAVAAFITTLTMVGIFTLPLEIRELGKKLAFLRNGLSFIIAIGVALIMGVIL
ncbi:MAG: permease [Chloroflexi bacterium]|nr:permease [Chloroflexota bacterium]MBT7081603.1 permease [Chloroflexota bacterium]MBT7290069.1 permease [Chloroflexota bacterium]